MMLGMILPMTIATSVSTTVALRSIRRKMTILLNGIQSVAFGNLDTRLNPSTAEEFSTIYENFNHMAAELKNTKAEMETFVNEYSHELKTAISSISGFAQLLVETGEHVESPERLEYLQIIAQESMRLSDLSQKMLLLSKVDACETIIDKEHYDLSEQIKQCVILLLPQIERKKIELELSLDSVLYFGNPDLMKQVWINLLNNAIKFTPENGIISICLTLSPNKIDIIFADTGIGMDEDTISHIFLRYYQKGSANSALGNGIGLSIVHRIVTLCNGTIKVESSPNNGSTFRIALPR